MLTDFESSLTVHLNFTAKHDAISVCSAQLTVATDVELLQESEVGDIWRQSTDLVVTQGQLTQLLQPEQPLQRHHTALRCSSHSNKVTRTGRRMLPALTLLSYWQFPYQVAKQIIFNQDIQNLPFLGVSS